jgi:hypothetical protein
MQVVQFKTESTSLNFIETLLNNLKITIKDFSISNESKVILSDSNYFKTKEDEYIFYLVELDGEMQQEKLKISRMHYADKEKAKKWRDELITMVHPDKSNHSNATKATKKINEIYKRMIKNAK